MEMEKTRGRGGRDEDVEVCFGSNKDRTDQQRGTSQGQQLLDVLEVEPDRPD